MWIYVYIPQRVSHNSPNYFHKNAQSDEAVSPTSNRHSYTHLLTTIHTAAPNPQSEPAGLPGSGQKRVTGLLRLKKPHVSLRVH